MFVFFSINGAYTKKKEVRLKHINGLLNKNIFPILLIMNQQTDVSIHLEKKSSSTTSYQGFEISRFLPRLQMQQDFNIRSIMDVVNANTVDTRQ